MGLETSSFVSSASHIYLVKVVLPAPRPPLKAMISPGFTVFANFWAKAAVSASLLDINFSVIAASFYSF